MRNEHIYSSTRNYVISEYSLKIRLLLKKNDF